MGKYIDLAKEIIENLGGKENIKNVTHCMTRLRFEVKNFNEINDKKLKENPNIISTNKSAGKYQVIVGNIVGDVYDDIVSIIGINIVDDSPEKEEGLVNKFINVITRIITPTLGVLVSTGLLKGLISILIATNLIKDSSGTYIILNALGDALFYFFPIILGYTSAETFGLNKFIGMILGATLIYPGINEAMLGGDSLLKIFSESPFEMVAFKSFLGLPIFFPGAGYSTTVIPIILVTLFASKVEKLLKNYIHDIVGFAFVPFLTLVISAPLSFLIIGPVANILQSFIGWITVSLYKLSPILTAIIVALIYQPLVIFGLHWPLITLAITNFGTLGYDFLWPMMFTASFAQTAVTMAVGFKTKNKKLKATSIPAIISGFMCIIEPAIYGFTLKDKKRFGISCISAAIGGVIITLFNAVQYSLGIGLLGFSGFINPNGETRNLIIALIATLITMIVAFVLTVITFKEVDDDPIQSDKENNDNENLNKIEIYSPVEGNIVDLESVEDSTFRNELLGKTVAIEPEIGVIVAPFDGEVISMFSTGHAVGLKGYNGESVLIHVGLDTVNLKGKHFSKIVNENSKVKKGDILIKYEIEKIREEGYDPTVIIILENSESFKHVNKTYKDKISFIDKLFY
ncbi:beta-glucoside-specific PTS transporter subunit IIABC [Helcococcus sueciensis]|uniref:beta-glucoside-specific PTS transporter subunit IIABC n=1 Tax=Helcococcus sueciensis TaxID=241555 RepID=UPI000404B23E|nr:beta-glucoside-specific PTS transporter subunit IIABC [Helcococcus sueciensis]